MDALIVKIGAVLVDALKWAWVAIMALVLYIFRQNNTKLDNVINDVKILQNSVVYRSDLDAKAEEIKAEVKHEHQRIIDEQREDNKKMRDELVTCNQNVMTHIASLATDVREIRTTIMHIIERRQGGS